MQPELSASRQTGAAKTGSPSGARVSTATVASSAPAPTPGGGPPPIQLPGGRTVSQPMQQPQRGQAQRGQTPDAQMPSGAAAPAAQSSGRPAMSRQQQLQALQGIGALTDQQVPSSRCLSILNVRDN